MSELNFSADPLDILKAKLEDHELQEPEIITAPKIFYEDVSSEAFAYHIAIGHPSASLWSDEGGLFVASNDATGTSASFNYPRGITTDGTNLYVVDRVKNRIRKIE